MKKTLRTLLAPVFVVVLLCSPQLLRAQQPVADTPPVERIDTLQTSKPLTINQKRAQRGLSDRRNLFVPRGQWVFGGTFSFSEHTNTDYQFLVIDGIASNGYTVKVSPMVGYAFTDNMVLGIRVGYGRTLFQLDKADLHLGQEDSGLNLTANHYNALRQTYSVAAIWRAYIPLGKSKRFALFNEMQLGGGGITSRFANDQPVKGTYETGYSFSLGISPGIVAFATNNMAVEVNVGVLGLSYTHVKQVHNQVEVGTRNTSGLNFNVNLLSIGVGLAFYL